MYTSETMTDSSSKHAARTYEEAKAIETARSGDSLKSRALRLLVALMVGWRNSLIWVLHGVLFRKGSRADDELKEICIYTVGTVGDNVLMLPAIAAIRRAYPQARITAITNCVKASEHGAREIIGKSPHVDLHVALPDHPVQRRGYKIDVNFPRKDNCECDLFINLSFFGNSGWPGAVIREMLFARWLGAKRAIGFRMSTYNRKGMFNAVQHYFVENEARRPRQVLEELGLLPVEGEDLLPRDVQARKKVEGIVAEHSDGLRQPIFVLNPGAKLKASHWPAERFGKVAAWLAETYRGCVVINGTMGEKELCEHVARASGGKAVSLAGELTIQELVELLRISAACITNNTGTMTLSAMVGTPEIVISSTRFSPTFYMPITDRMIWLFSFGDNSYSYDDDVEVSEDLLNITEEDVIKAVEELVPLQRPPLYQRLDGFEGISPQV